MAAPLALGIDLGGTNLRVAVVDAAGTILRRNSVPTEVAGGPEAIIAQITSLARNLGGADWERVSTVGVAAPGPLDSDAGVILGIPTLPGWEDYPLHKVLVEKFQRPVVLENDGIAAAFGEWKSGAGQGFSHMVYVTVSTGIGGGIVADNRLLRGWRGMAGHVGHMLIASDGPRCACGAIGCFEALASGTAFSAAARHAGFADAASAVAAARLSDSSAIAVVNREADLLGYGFTSLLHLYAPQRLIVGGGVSEALDLMQPRIKAQLNLHAMLPFRDIEIVRAGLGDNSGLVGAAMLAMTGRSQ